MAGDRLHNLIHYIRRVAAPADGTVVSDAQLLERFVTQRDESAFELLVWRHGAMVQGVCRRVLGHAHDAEDAFQATFLVLARKAASAARHRSPGAWLYTVAYHVALRARARRVARAAREEPLDEPPPAAALDPADEVAWRDARRVIDEEVNRLPAKYRVPFVLFHLEGRSSAEVARELGCPVGTVESWLTRARERLRARLARRGLTPAPGLLAALAPQEGWFPQAAAARAALAAGRGTAGAVSVEAAALADGIMRALGTATTKVTVVVLLLGVALAATAGLATRLAPRAEDPARPEAPQEARWAEARPAERAGTAEPVKLGTIHGHITGISAVALSPDGKILASSATAQVKLWDVATLEELASLRRATTPPRPREQLYAHEWPADTLAFSPDGKTLASGSRDKTVKLWDVATGEELATLRDTVCVYAVAFCPDGKALASAGGFQPAADIPIQDFKAIPTHPESKEFGEAKVWDLATGKARAFHRGDTGRVMSVAFSPDGETLAAGLRDGAIRLWDVATGSERVCLRENGQVRAVAFSPDGKTLASARGDQVELWDLATGRMRARLQGHAAWVRAVAFSPDGTLATVSDVPSRDRRQRPDATGEVRLWDAATGRPRGAPLIFPHDASSVAFGACGKILAAGGSRGNRRPPDEITLWRLGPLER
jgi:RNA polymerase sigma factor (sigma-70 family)